MSDQNTQQPAAALRRRSFASLLPDLWSVGAALIAVLVLAPVVSVVWIAFHPTENIWPHLLATVLPRYLGTTLLLMAGVAVLSAAMGTGAAVEVWTARRMEARRTGVDGTGTPE